MQKRMYDIAWWDEQKCLEFGNEEGTEKHRFCTTVHPAEKLETRTRRGWRNGNKGQQHCVVSPQRK